MDEWDECAAEAAEKVSALLALPMPEEYAIGAEGAFDPWSLFPALYGSYGADFDQCALDVLAELRDRDKRRGDLGAEMFREILCTAELCEYGSSPRVCFPTTAFRPLIPDLITKWQEYTEIQWGERLSPTQGTERCTKLR